MEVADTTLQYDRTLKLRAYAQAGIAVYWILNLEDRQVEAFTNPTAGATPSYGNRVIFTPGQQLPLLIAGQQVALVPVDRLLP